MVAVLVAVVLLALGLGASTRPGPVLGEGNSTGGAPLSVPDRTQQAGPPPDPGEIHARIDTHPGDPRGRLGNTWDALFAAGLAAVLLTVATVLVVRAVRRRQRTRALVEAQASGIAVGEAFSTRAQDTFRVALQRLRTGDDIDAAIIECWLDLEATAARTGMPRQRQQTATEFATALLARTGASGHDLATLRTLYQAAMFSDAPGTEAGREQAVESLTRLVQALGVRTQP